MYDRTVAVPRLVASYGEGDRLPDAALGEMGDALEEAYATVGTGRLASVGLCLYRDGADSVAWHGDTIGRNRPAYTVVAIVSLGEARRFLLRPRSGGPHRRLVLGHGDLLVMGGRCQRTWEHAVPKTSRPTGPRISIQFRTAGPR
jgi:alkylated DNA repair dioxygenase AlkB